MIDSAFDRLAPTYDDDFTRSPIAQFLRGRVQASLLARLQPADRALELGCGTGEDAAQLAQHGVHVTATDASAGMLTAARAKYAGLPGLTFAPLDLTRLPDADFRAGYRGVYANFGVLNCLTTWRPLAAWLADRIAPGGFAAFSLMSPLCLWETAWCAAHGDFKTAFRRWRAFSAFQPGDDAPTIYVRYPTVRRLTADFAPHFRRVSVSGIGLFLPPTDLYPVIERRPALLRPLLALERRFGATARTALLADHYWITFERR